jgi:hypothetical protein
MGIAPPPPLPGALLHPNSYPDIYLEVDKAITSHLIRYSKASPGPSFDVQKCHLQSDVRTVLLATVPSDLMGPPCGGGEDRETDRSLGGRLFGLP